MTPKTRVGPYEVVGPLGAGGMGEVYRARDLRLDREVALKVLPPALDGDAERVARFTREAKTLAALSHPHIAQVYGIEETDETRALVMELVPGETLAARLSRGTPPLREALELARQIADGLAAAHERGIVHRDVKPANIQVTPDGVVKVLDFGLAKVLAPPAAEEAGTALPTTQVTQMTAAGRVVGTPAYTSPEQMRGQPIDRRTDVWAFGCVLFELLSGRPAFGGATAPDVVAAVLEREPAWEQLPATTPAAVRALVQRCLRKDPKERLHDTADAKFLLEDALAVGRSPTPSTTSDHGAGAVGVSAPETPGEATTRDVRSDSANAPRFVKTMRRRGWSRRAVVALVTLSGIAVPAAWWLSSRTPAPPVGPPARVVPLTSLGGWTVQPTFSPDGQQVAFAWGPAPEQACNNFDIYVTIVGSMQVRRLTDSRGRNLAPSWSPDGRQIAFVHEPCGPDGARLRVMSALGGSDRALADFAVGSPGSWSPDGRYIAVVRAASGPTPDREDGIWLVPTQSGEPRVLSNPVRLGHFGHFSPAFSPDGHELAYLACPESLNCYVEVLELDATVSPVAPARRLTPTGFNRPRGLAWTPDGESVIFHNQTGSTVYHLWRVDADGRRPAERLEIAGVGATWPAISPTGNRLAFSRQRVDSDIDVLEPGGTRTVITSSFPDVQPAFSPDGQRIAFCSARSGDSVEVWVADADGSGAQQLTDGPGRWQCSPHWSPDGRRIVFDSQQTTGLHVWVIDADGGIPWQLTAEPGEQYAPTWSQDGHWVYYVWFDGKTRDVWRRRVAGGSPERITRGGASFGMESADGRSLVYTPVVPRPAVGRGVGEDMGAGHAPLLVVPLAGGPVRQLVKCGGRGGAFLPHRLGLYYVPCPSGGNTVVHRLDETTGRDDVVGSLARAVEGEGTYHGLAVSPDGARILFTKWASGNVADLWLIEDFR